MKYIRSFLTFWYHFIVGDDWRIAVSVIFGLSLTALLVHAAHVQFWWLLPALVVAVLTISLWLVTRQE